MLPLDLSKPKSFTEAVRTVLEKMGKVLFKYTKSNQNLFSMIDTFFNLKKRLPICRCLVSFTTPPGDPVIF